MNFPDNLKIKTLFVNFLQQTNFQFIKKRFDTFPVYLGRNMGPSE